jgi:hypothetical protein
MQTLKVEPKIKASETMKLLKRLQRCGYSLEKTAAELRLHYSTVQRWDAEKSEPHGGTLIRLRELTEKAESVKG